MASPGTKLVPVLSVEPVVGRIKPGMPDAHIMFDIDSLAEVSLNMA